MRRNEIIADFFGRLHFMDRRGSGLGRVLDAYEGNKKQPEFTSDTNFFNVTLPNRGAMDLLSHNDGEKQLIPLKPVANEFRQKRYDQIIDLFKKYRFNYSFNRRIVATAFGISDNAASIAIKKCIDMNIMDRILRDEYRFHRNKK